MARPLRLARSNPMLAPLRKIARFLPLFFVSVSTAACGSSEATSDDSQTPSTPDAENDQGESTTGAERAIAEADIVQVNDGRLYAMSKSGSVAIVDISTPGRLTLLGKARLPGQPFEMY